MRGGGAGARTTLRVGADAMAPALRRMLAGHRALLIRDAQVGVPPGTDGTPMVVVEAASVGAGSVADLAQRIRAERPSVLVALGGGTVLDAAKLASLALAPGPLLDFVLTRAERSALVVLPPGTPPLEVIAIPSTLGTSSETNAVAVLRNDRGFRLVAGAPLRPAHAILDGGILASLPADAVQEGCLEALLRVAGFSTGRGGVRSRSHAVTLGCALVEVGNAPEGTAGRRLRIARLSAATQRSAALRGRDPYGARHWYIANEVSFHLGVRKMTATAAIVAAVWARIVAGDVRWGQVERLAGFWAPVARRHRLPEDPAAGIARLLDRWRIARPPRPSAAALDMIAQAVIAAWGSAPPALPGLTCADIRELLDGADWRSQALSVPGSAIRADSDVLKERG